MAVSCTCLLQYYVCLHNLDKQYININCSVLENRSELINIIDYSYILPALSLTFDQLLGFFLIKTTKLKCV